MGATSRSQQSESPPPGLGLEDVSITFKTKITVMTRMQQVIYSWSAIYGQHFGYNWQMESSGEMIVRTKIPKKKSILHIELVRVGPTDIPSRSVLVDTVNHKFVSITLSLTKFKLMAKIQITHDFHLLDLKYPSERESQRQLLLEVALPKYYEIRVFFTGSSEKDIQRTFESMYFWQKFSYKR